MRYPLIVLAAVTMATVATIAPAVGAAARTSPGARSTAPAAYDVSYPQCGGSLPAGGTTGIVGVTAGRPFSSNSCLASEYRWAAAKPQPAQFYMNTANPETASAYWTSRAGTGPRPCDSTALNDPANLNCAYNYGWNAAQDALGQTAATVGGAAATHAWWLDVETANSWNGSTGANAQDLQGSVDYLQSAGVPGTGFYSTSYQWGVITGGYHPATGAPADWIAGAGSASQAASWCPPSNSFSGGRVSLVQYPSGSFDGDYIC